MSQGTLISVLAQGLTAMQPTDGGTKTERNTTTRDQKGTGDVGMTPTAIMG